MLSTLIIYNLINIQSQNTWVKFRVKCTLRFVFPLEQFLGKTYRIQLLDGRQSKNREFKLT